MTHASDSLTALQVWPGPGPGTQVSGALTLLCACRMSDRISGGWIALQAQSACMCQPSVPTTESPVTHAWKSTSCELLVKCQAGTSDNLQERQEPQTVQVPVQLQCISIQAASQHKEVLPEHPHCAQQPQSTDTPPQALVSSNVSIHYTPGCACRCRETQQPSDVHTRSCHPAALLLDNAVVDLSKIFGRLLLGQADIMWHTPDRNSGTDESAAQIRGAVHVRPAHHTLGAPLTVDSTTSIRGMPGG
jgi:hypothetical protein